MNPLTVTDVLTAHTAYVESALWASTFVDDQGDDVPMDVYYGPEDLAPAALVTLLSDVVTFVVDHLDLIRTTRGLTARSIGHDLWLTRNRHGAGFWDRGLGEPGQRLTTGAHAMGSCELYVGDDGAVVHAS